MKPSDYLKRGWCQGEEALDARGIKVFGVLDPDACWWCYTAASDAALGVNTRKSKQFIRTTAVKIYPKAHSGDARMIVMDWNDSEGQTKTQVLKMAERVEKEMGL